MPTFQSIGLHPELRNRLVTERYEYDQQQQQQVHRQPISTPMALLSRHPKSLRLLSNDDSTSRPLSYMQATKFRCEVSQALIADTQHGRFIQHVTETNAHLHSKDIHCRYGDEDTAEEETGSNEESNRMFGMVSLLNLITSKSATAETWFLSTGSVSLDNLLSFPQEFVHLVEQTTLMREGSIMETDEKVSSQRGFPSGYVIQFSGPPSSGKTQLALTLAHHQQPSSPIHRTFYISSNPNVRILALRLQQMIQSGFGSTQNCTDTIMERTEFSAVHDDVTLFIELSRIEAQMEEALVKGNSESLCRDEYDNNDFDDDSASSTQRRCLLVVDSVSGCLTPQVSDCLGVGRVLRRMARLYNMVVVVINGSVQDRASRTERNKPALGQAWGASIPDVSVWMQPVGSCNNAIDCHLLKHIVKPVDERQKAQCYVGGKGIQEKRGFS